MELTSLLRANEEVQVDETISMENASLTKNDSLPQEQLNLSKFDVGTICLMDISSNKKWLCYVSQSEHTTGEVTSTLTVRKFTALNDETLREESATVFENLQDSRVHMEDSPEPDMISICVSKYFDTTNCNSHVLSICSDGQYITLSSHDEKATDSEGGCIVFKVQNRTISYHCELKCNGYAVFLDRENELCLAILSMETLKIYQNISSFSKDMPCNVYDMAPFTKTWNAMESSQWHYSYSDCRGTILASFYYRLGPDTEEWKLIISLSAYIKKNILLAPPAITQHKIRFFSLKLDGVLLSSIYSSNSVVVIAISDDLKYAATIAEYCLFNRYSDEYDKSYPTVEIYSLENGCLLYTLKSRMRMTLLPHATFCCNSRYLALSSLQGNLEQETHGADATAIFEVWHIENQTSIYSATKRLKQTIDLTTDWCNNTRIQLLKPFILEERTNTGIVLKGFYSQSDHDNIHVTMKCFHLNLDCQNQNSTIQWLIKDDLLLEKELNPDDAIVLSNREFTDKLMELDGQPEHKLDAYLDDKEGYTSIYNCLEFEIADPFNFRRHKCGYFMVGNDTFFLSCSYNIVQLWRLVEGPSSESTLMRDHQLVYIKPFINSDHRGFYLCPNVWRIESFRSLKILGSPPNPRLIVNIVEDNLFLNPMRGNLTPYTEELILPVTCNNNVFDHNTFEGACQALYFLIIIHIQNRNFTDLFYWRRYISLYNKCMGLIRSEIEKIDGNCTFFKKTAGSKTLAMLASFKKGRDILKMLLKNKAVVFSLIDYEVITAYGEKNINFKEDRRYYTGLNFLYDSQNWDYRSARTMTEGVLLVLIREREYQLYHLMFNRILSDSKKAGPEGLLALNNALLLLEKLRNNDHYVKSSLKLSYLPVAGNFLLSQEIPQEIQYKASLQEDLITNVGDLSAFTALEQIPKLGAQHYGQKFNFYTIRRMKKPFHAMMEIWRTCIDYFTIVQEIPTNQLVPCIVPLSHFNTYYTSTVREAHVNFTNSKSKNVASAQSPFKKESLFMQLSLNQYHEPNIWKQGDDVMAILLQYKWRAFIRHRFLLICAIHLVYYVSYSTGVQFALEMYNYDSSSEERSIAANSRHVTSIVLFFCSGYLLLQQEFRQIPKNRKFIYYLNSWFNYVDLAAIVIPFFVFLQMVLNWDYFYEVSSASTLVLWLHGIIRLRVFPSFGIALETILQLFRKVSSTLFILVLVNIAFTHAIIVLLRQREDQYFQENYSGNVSISSTNGTTIAGETSLYDLSSSNGFNDPFKAFYHVWLFIFGVWDPITTGDAGDNRMLFVLSILFAFVTVLIFINMIIALMSSTVEEVKKLGKKVWMTHFSAVIAEVENFTSVKTRHDRANNPAMIFYLGNSEKVKRQEEKLQLETEELRRILLTDDETDGVFVVGDRGTRWG